VEEVDKLRLQQSREHLELHEIAAIGHKHPKKGLLGSLNFKKKTDGRHRSGESKEDSRLNCKERRQKRILETGKEKKKGW